MVKARPEKAFPSTFKSFSPEESQIHVWGMDLRDYFAAYAMSELINIFAHQPYETQEQRVDAVAKSSYVIADAMIRAREAK